MRWHAFAVPQSWIQVESGTAHLCRGRGVIRLAHLEKAPRAVHYSSANFSSAVVFVYSVLHYPCSSVLSNCISYLSTIYSSVPVFLHHCTVVCLYFYPIVADRHCIAGEVADASADSGKSAKSKKRS